jgi:Zn-dependent protease
MPIAPLDGSKILYGLLPTEKAIAFRQFTERYSIFLLVFFIFILWDFVLRIVQLLAELLSGINLI